MDGMIRNPFDVDAIRADFPILASEHRGRKLVFLDSGASAQKPVQPRGLWLELAADWQQ